MQKTIRRLRSIGEILKYIRKEDEDSEISRYFIETLMVERKVYYIKSGNKYLVDLDDVLRNVNQNAI